MLSHADQFEIFEEGINEIGRVIVYCARKKADHNYPSFDGGMKETSVDGLTRIYTQILRYLILAKRYNQRNIACKLLLLEQFYSLLRSED